MNGRKKDDKPITWEDVLAFLYAKRENMDRMSRGWSLRGKEFEVSINRQLLASSRKRKR